jgi:hypothetical protein
MFFGVNSRATTSLSSFGTVEVHMAQAVVVHADEGCRIVHPVFQHGRAVARTIDHGDGVEVLAIPFTRYM